MLYNIRYWWFFLSQGNWWTKYLEHPKIRKLKPCLLMFYLWLLWTAFTGCCPLSRQPVYAKTTFCCIETVANMALNRQCVVVFDRLWANVAPTMNTAFTLTNVSAKWWIHLPSDIFNISAILCFFNLQSAKTSLWSFLVFQLPNLGYLSVQHHLCLYNRV